jgi:carboxypeptidase C (cathepsin A)
VAGAFLISPVLEFSLISGDSFALLPDVLRLPSYAAVLLERSGAPTADALAEAERFALGPYLTALAATPRNQTLMPEIVREVARFTGVPEAVIARHDGRVPLGVFVKEARRTDKLLSSRYDGSATGPDPNPDSAGLAATLCSTPTYGLDREHDGLSRGPRRAHGPALRACPAARSCVNGTGAAAWAGATAMPAPPRR